MRIVFLHSFIWLRWKAEVMLAIQDIYLGQTSRMQSPQLLVLLACMKILLFFKKIPDTRYCVCQMYLSFAFVKYSKTVIKTVFKQWKITIWASIGFRRSQQRWKNWCRISYSSISGPDGDVIWLLSTAGERDWQDAQKGADTFVRSAVHTTAWQ